MFIVGASTLGQMALAVAKRSGEPVDGFYDDSTLDRERAGVPILGGIEDLARSSSVRERGVFVAIGDNRNRRAYSARLREMAVPLVNVIDARATIEPCAVLGHGNLVMAGVYIGVQGVIGSGNLFFPGVSITHHNVVGDFCFFSPNCSVGGYAQIGDECKVSMNCVVQPYRRIASGTVTEPLTLVVGLPLP